MHPQVLFVRIRKLQQNYTINYANNCLLKRGRMCRVGGFGEISELGVEGNCQSKQTSMTELDVAQLGQITS